MKKYLLFFISLITFLASMNLTYPQAKEKSRFYDNVELSILSNYIYQPDKLPKIQESSDYLSYEEKIGLYGQYSKSPGTKLVGFLLNAVTIPGLGSLVIGDNGGALTTFVGVFGGGLFSLLGFLSVSDGTYKFYSWPMILGGIGVASVFYLNGIISPFTYSEENNRALRLSLKLHQRDLNRAGMKTETTLPLILNIIPGGGLGSFAQGDGLGGLIGLMGELTGGVCLFMGYAGMSSSIRTEAIVFVVAGYSIFGLSKVFEIIRPFWYASDHDNNIALLPNDGPYYAVKPYVIPELRQDRLGIQAGFNLKFGL